VVLPQNLILGLAICNSIISACSGIDVLQSYVHILVIMAVILVVS